MFFNEAFGRNDQYNTTEGDIQQTQTYTVDNVTVIVNYTDRKIIYYENDKKSDEIKKISDEIKTRNDIIKVINDIDNLVTKPQSK